MTRQTLSAKAAAALDKELMSTGAFSIDQLMELAGLSVSQAGTFPQLCNHQPPIGVRHAAELTLVQCTGCIRSVEVPGFSSPLALATMVSWLPLVWVFRGKRSLPHAD